MAKCTVLTSPVLSAVVAVSSGDIKNRSAIGRLLVGSRLLSSVTLCTCSMTSLQRFQQLCSAPALPCERRFFLTRLHVDAIKKGNGSKHKSGFRQSRFRVDVVIDWCCVCSAGSDFLGMTFTTFVYSQKKCY